MNKSIILIIREENITDRVRLSKLIGYFNSKNYQTHIWKKQGINDGSLNESFYNISKSNRNKKIEFLVWMVNLFFKLLKRTNSNTVFFVTGFESAFVVFITSMITKRQYIFDNADNFYQSKNFPIFLKRTILKIENRIINKSIFTIIPDGTRATGYSVSNDIFVIIKNFPSKSDFDKSIENPFKKNLDHLIIYINGWLVETRGLKMIELLINRLDSNLPIKILIAGKSENIKHLKNKKNVKFLGQLNSIDSLKYYHLSDLVLTFYDPSIEINRYATPNKWGDCLVTNTVPIINREILTIKDYFPYGGFFEIKYNDVNTLLKIIVNICRNKSILINKQKELKKNPIYFWETQLDKILSKHNI